MRGWLRKPSNILKQKVNGISVVMTTVDVLLNDRDPDVSFAYTFCGSIGTTKAAEASAERGKIKAIWEDSNRTWPTEINAWTKTLKGVPPAKLQIQRDGTFYHGLWKNRIASIQFLSTGMTARIEVGGYTIQRDMEIEPFELKKWLIDAKKRIKKVRSLYAISDGLGVRRPDIYD